MNGAFAFTMGRRLIALALMLITLLPALPASAQDLTGQDLQGVNFEQHLGAQLPLDLVFRNEYGDPVALRGLLRDRPAILVFGYLECPNLCTLVHRGLAESLREIAFTVGNEFDVISISIDPNESSTLALVKEDEYLEIYGRPGAESGWHILTGQEESIRTLADTVGFHYVYDESIQQYAHPSGIVMVTPAGVVSRYFYGVMFQSRDLRLGLVESADGKIGSPVDKLLLMCYHYDPLAGSYSVVAWNVVRLASAATAVGLAGTMVFMFRRERRQPGGGQPAL